MFGKSIDGQGRTTEMPDVSFVDDIANTVSAPAGKNISTAMKTAEIAYSVYARQGMALNFKVGKSERLINWAGPRDDSVKHKVYADSEGGILKMGGHSQRRQLLTVEDRG